MNGSTIGIKLADGTFYPILEENTPAKKTLEVTTVQDNQTTVQVNLYKSDYGKPDHNVYVGTLLIANLNPHPQGDPTISVNIILDENNMLSAEAIDAESGEKSNLSVSLVTLETGDLSDSAGFDIKSDPDADDVSLSDFDDLPDFSDMEPPSSTVEADQTDDSFDLSLPDDFSVVSDSDDTFAADTDFTMPLLPDDNDAVLEDDSESRSASSDQESYSSVINDFDYLEQQGITQSKNKKQKAVIICIICAAVSVIVLAAMLFLYFTRPEIVIESSPPSPVLTVQPEKTPEPAEKPFEAQENKIVVVDAPVVAPAEPPVSPIKPAEIRYKIKWGDTLWDIADAYYKNPWLYKKIARANSIKNPDYIISGTWIVIPPK